MADLYQNWEIEEEVGALLVYSLFKLLFCTVFWKNYVFFGGHKSSSETIWEHGLQNDSFHIQLCYHSIAAWINRLSNSDVTRLIASEHVRNKFSLQSPHTVIQLSCF